MIMKRFVRTILFIAFILFSVVSCLPYATYKEGEYRVLTLYNNTPEIVDVTYLFYDNTSSTPCRIDKGSYERMRIYTLGGMADISVSGPYAVYKKENYEISADSLSSFKIESNRALISVRNNTGMAVENVSLGPDNNSMLRGATYDIENNTDKIRADIASGETAGIRVTEEDIATSGTTPFYIYFSYRDKRYRTRASVSLPEVGSSLDVVLSLSECMSI